MPNKMPTNQEKEQEEIKQCSSKPSWTLLATDRQLLDLKETISNDNTSMHIRNYV